MRFETLRSVQRISASLALVAALGGAAAAKSWCAKPLWVHEWGVHVFAGGGALTPGASRLPSFFHAPGKTLAFTSRAPVKTLPPDSGDRDLPVMHFYSPRTDGTIPVGLEVGFTLGTASSWFPDVDLFDALAHKQLAWNRLELSRVPAFPAAMEIGAQPDELAWIASARKLGALWVNSARETERFVFYEARTRETVPLELKRGATWAPGRRHYELHNRGAFAVHDVLVVVNEGATTYVFAAPQIPARTSAGFLVEDHAVTDVRAATFGALTTALLDPVTPEPPTDYRWDSASCVMQRNPATPFARADGHRLYRGEVVLILEVWGARFFETPGTSIVYREDTAYLDQVMPVAVYTDMYNFVVLQRAGLALWSGVTLP